MRGPQPGKVWAGFLTGIQFQLESVLMFKTNENAKENALRGVSNPSVECF